MSTRHSHHRRCVRAGMPLSWEEIFKPSRRRRDVPALTNVCVIICRGRREEEDPAWSTYVSDIEPRVLAAVSSRRVGLFCSPSACFYADQCCDSPLLGLAGKGVSGAQGGANNANNMRASRYPIVFWVNWLPPWPWDPCKTC